MRTLSNGILELQVIRVTHGPGPGPDFQNYRDFSRYHLISGIHTGTMLRTRVSPGLGLEPLLTQ